MFAQSVDVVDATDKANNLCPFPPPSLSLQCLAPPRSALYGTASSPRIYVCHLLPRSVFVIVCVFVDICHHPPSNSISISYYVVALLLTQSHFHTLAQ